MEENGQGLRRTTMVAVAGIDKGYFENEIFVEWKLDFGAACTTVASRNARIPEVPLNKMKSVRVKKSHLNKKKSIIRMARQI